nr:MAG TPA: hypothetical protein [Caudoviricetes sp.]
MYPRACPSGSHIAAPVCLPEYPTHTAQAFDAPGRRYQNPILY